MYEKLNIIISEFEQNDDITDNEWSSFAVNKAINYVDNFNEDDWKKIYQELPLKTLNWKKRLIDCLDPNDDNQLKIIEYLASIDDKELFSDIVFKLLPFDIYRLENPDLLFEKVEELLPLVDEYNQINFNNFLEKKTISK